MITAVPASAAASAWTGAIAGSRGTVRPQARAVISAASAAVNTAHSSQAALASAAIAGPPRKAPGSGGPASRPSAHGTPASRAAASAALAAARSRRAVPAGRRRARWPRRCRWRPGSLLAAAGAAWPGGGAAGGMALTRPPGSLPG